MTDKAEIDSLTNDISNIDITSNDIIEDDSNDISDDENECPICYENIDNDDKITMPKCKHICHRTCLKNWIKTLKKTKHNKCGFGKRNYSNNLITETSIRIECPLCRTKSIINDIGGNKTTKNKKIKKDKKIKTDKKIKKNKKSSNSTDIKCEPVDSNKKYIPPPGICGAPLKTKNKFCSFKGKEKYGGRCGHHKNII